jgi:Tfp pilus assembly PilM family ATPase
MFRQQLGRQLELTYEQAGATLWQPAKARRFHEWLTALQPLFVQVGSEIERSLTTYLKSNSEQSICRVYGLGGAFQTHGLLSYLRTGK